MAENYSSIISSNAFDFENNNAQKTNIFTAKNITRPIDQLPSSGGQPIEVIPPGGIDEIPEGGGQPIKVTPPPEVNQALYEITFNRKLYGANLDVVNTLEDIEFKQGFSGIKTPTLNIAYLTHWRRGNSPTAGEKISTENTDIKNTEFKTDKSTQTFEILENSTFKNSALIDYKGGQIGTGEGRITLNNSSIKSFLNEFPVWEVRAPDAIERNETIQPSDLRILDSVSINVFEEEEEFIFSDGYYGFDEDSAVLFEQFKSETRPSKQDLISKAKQQLEIERAKDSPSSETIKYLEDKIKQLESIDDSQFVQETNLPPDPRQETPTEPSPIGGEVRKADVSWTDPSISTQNQTEKVEGIWQFLFNPQTLERSFGPEFKYATSWGVPDGQAAHYSGHKNEELRFRDIILNGFVFGKRVESLVKGLEELTYVERDSGQQSPPVLEFVWGKKVFGPCVMEDISVAEQKWDGGELVDATLSFTLKKIPEWVVNDEYINIFDPSGQPLQQIIVPDPASSTTGADTSAGGDTQAGTADQTGVKSDPKASPSCKKVVNDYLGRYNSVLRSTVNALNNVRRGTNKVRLELELQEKITDLRDIISNFHQIGIGFTKSEESDPVKTILKDSFNAYNQRIMNGLVNSLSKKIQYILIDNKKNTGEYVVNKYVTGVLISSVESTASGLKKWCKEAQIASVIKILNSISTSVEGGPDNIDREIKRKICIASSGANILTPVDALNKSAPKVVRISDAKNTLRVLNRNLNRLNQNLRVIKQQLESQSNVGGTRQDVKNAAKLASDLTQRYRELETKASVYRSVKNDKGKITDFILYENVAVVSIKCDSPQFALDSWNNEYILAAVVDFCENSAENIYKQIKDKICLTYRPIGSSR